MRRFRVAHGLLGFEDIRASARTWLIPLPRGPAQRVRAKLAAHPDARQIPFRRGGLDLEQLELRRGNGRIQYLLAGSRAALRRVVIVESPEPTELLEAADLSDLAAEPDDDTQRRHARALSLAKLIPEVLARAWLDDDTWPPSWEALEQVETDEQIPSGHAADVCAEPGGELVRRDALGLGSDAPDLYIARRSPDGVASMIETGSIPARWRLLLQGAPGSTSPRVDLQSGGASFIFARILTGRRAGLMLDESFDYAVLLSARAIDQMDRFVLERERFGAFNALTRSMRDADLASAITEDRLNLSHEVLFPICLPASLASGVICRTDKDRDALLRSLSHPPRIPIVVGDRLVPSDAL